MPQLRRQPRQTRARATFDAILDAAAQLFAEHGYAATTTNRVAERAGVSIGSLYQYVSDKDALLLALAERHLQEAADALSDTFRALHRDRPDVAETVRRLVATLADLHRHDPAMHRLLFDQTPRTPALAARLRQAQRDLGRAVAAELIRLGVAGPHPQARALLLVQGLEAQVHGAVLEPPPDSSSAELIDELIALWTTTLGHIGQGGAETRID
ncbi:MAG: TetR/AcrR family transcriptional regulator [Pseudomonadales bacterium]